MLELENLARFAAQHRIRGRSYKRSSLLKPLDFILDALERCPDPQSKSDQEFARVSSEGMLFDHIKRVARGVHDEHIHEYVEIFFDSVLEKDFHANVYTILQRERALRSAYLIYTRRAITQIMVERGKAKTPEDAATQVEQAAENEQELDEMENASL